MYLKKLQLFGFKSFANKTEFLFEPGVTAVVGPNGCGKSNISDSIKWVLGEQSARSLRGLKMEDVIFNGTVNKEPVSFAEVALTISNHSKILPIDYEEVTIARRLYRSGESEYLLNKLPVRLKDIHDLLMGTGIGVDNYFLMEQGKIDLVLSSKPEERRAIFEEASGITKFKSKKREAMNKLEQTQANILRINDIISELQRQMNSIERQAAKARRYQKHFQHLKDLELRVAGVENEELEKDYKGIDDQIKKIKQQQENFISNVESLSCELKSTRQDLERIDSQIADTRNTFLTTENEIFKSKERLELNKERIQELNASILQLQDYLNSSIGKISDLKKQIELLSKEKESFWSEKSAKEAMLQEKNDSLVAIEKSIEEAQKTISNSKADILELTTRHARAKNESAKVAANTLTAANRLKRLEVERQASLGSINKAKDALAISEQELNIQKQKVDSLQLELEKVGIEFENAETQANSLNKSYDVLQKEYLGAQSRVEFLRDVLKKHEGFSDSVKVLLDESNKDKTWYSGILGVLADLIVCAENYEIGIESALIEDLEAVVVENASVAQKTIDYLKENNLDRVKFVILPDPAKENRITGFMARLGLEKQNNISHPAILGKATEFINADPSFHALITDLLENTWIVKDLNSAFEISSKIDTAKIVTLEGEIVFGNLVISKSSKKDNSIGLIGREAKLNQAEQGFKDLSNKLQLLENEKEENTQIVHKLKVSLEALNEQVHQEQIQLANKQNNNQQLSQEFSKLKDEISVVEMELDDLSEETGHLKQQDETLKTQIDSLEKQLGQIDALINSNQDWIQVNLKEKEAAIVEITKTKSELESLAHRQQNLENSLTVLIESLDRDNALYESRVKEIDESKIKISTLEEEIKQLSSGVVNLESKKSSIEKNLSDITNNKKEFFAKVSEKEQEYEKCQKTLQEINSQVYALETKAAQVTFQQQRLKDKISQVYKVDIGSYKLIIQQDPSLPQQEQTEFNFETAKTEIEELRAKLDSIGSVNLDAVSEEKELQERFNFIISQRDDLLKAKDALLEAISKINKTAKEMFIETFSKVQVEFRNFFKLLFGGGDTELFLVDEQDVLESGIEIVARPPGKRLQNISLLSGGEKTMTALALLFAVFKVKPSPFCLMDEMDAPLDEANIDRFSRVLAEFTKNSQFIIITHNKKTITIADVMYGITMEESGISKVVSVKFGERKQEPLTEETVAAQA